MDDAADGVVVLPLVGEIDAAVVAPVTRQARELLRRPAVDALVVDLGAVTFVDSLGLGLLINLRALAEDRGAAFALRQVPPSVNRVLELTGLLHHLPAE